MMDKVKAIVFDLDGILIDSEPLAQEAWSRVLRDLGKELDGETFSRMIGLRLKDSSLLVKEVYGLANPAEELADMESSHMKALMTAGIPALPGALELTVELDRRQVPWAVATSSRREYATMVLSQLDLLDRCAALATGDQVRRGKPAPDVYLLAAERLGLDPASCAAIEDSLPGIHSAKAAGMLAIAIPNGETISFSFSDADRIYSSLLDLMPELDELLDSIRR